MDGLASLGAAGQHVADRRRRVGVDVEVVGQVALRVEVDRQHASGSTRRNTSVSVRTAVVLPVPPFCESTAIVAAIGAGTIGQQRAPATCAVAPQISIGRSRRAVAGAGCKRMPEIDRHIDEVQVVAADHDLVAVGERAPLDPLAVDEHAVEAAVVEHAQAVRLADDQRVAARHGRVVEADVGGQAAADPRPLALQRERDDVAVDVR